MSPFEVREEVINVVLAELLEDRAVLFVPESIRRAVTGRIERPVEILVVFGVVLD